MLSTIKEKLEVKFIQQVLSIPRGVRTALFKQPPLVRGEKLNEDFATLLNLQATLNIPSLSELGQQQGVAAARHEYKRVMKMGTKHRDIDQVLQTDILIQGDDSDNGAPSRPARLYQPKNTPNSALLVYFHGGGFILGDLDAYDGLLTFLTRNAGLSILSVDYRLCPEHPYPSGKVDCIHALEQALDGHIPGLEEYSKILVGGDSAGAVMALTSAHEVTQVGGKLDGVFLINPGPHVMGMYPSDEDFGKGYGFTRTMREWFEGMYTNSLEPCNDPAVSPLMIDDLSKLPPTWLSVGGCDPLRDQCELLAEKLVSQNVDINFSIEPGMIHNYPTFLALVPEAKQDTLKACEWLKRYANL